MRASIKYRAFLVFLIPCLYLPAQDIQAPETVILQINSVIDKVIHETSFKLVPERQKSDPFFQFLNLNRIYKTGPDHVFYAGANINCSEPGGYTFGIASGCPVEIAINGNPVYRVKDRTDGMFSEVAYNIYNFPEKFNVECHRGNNLITVKIFPAENRIIQMGILDERSMPHPGAGFTALPGSPFPESNWLLSGPFPENEAIPDSVFLFSQGTMPLFDPQQKCTAPFLPVQNMVFDIEIPEQATFRKHSYAEWQYSTGITMWSIYRYAHATGQLQYGNFVRDFSNFTADHYDWFHHQYHDLGEIHGFNHRMIRLHMLDDASAPALPFLRLALDGIPTIDRTFLDELAGYLMHGQYRLDDGTLCRPEPSEWTIWADDLFMSAPFLLMYSDLTGDEIYSDEAVFQALQFYNYLFDNSSGLAHHGWYEGSGDRSSARWSRANGWLIWGLTEILTDLPPTHKDYSQLIAFYRKHVDGLKNVQQSDGLLCQLLDEPGTFHETSSTAMYLLAVCRGIENGWLPENYLESAALAWQGISSRILGDGTVTGICQGTGMSEDLDFYRSRNTPGHDPRGLGAVITAGTEFILLLEKMNNGE